MRSIFILAMAVLLFGCSETDDTNDNANTTTNTTTAQADNNIPQAVSDAMASLYPNAQQVEWEKEDSRYEGTFKMNGMETTVIFNADGSVYATEKEIDVATLPDVVKTAAAANGNAKEAAMITLADGTVQYEVEVGNVAYTYNVDGSVAGQEASDDKDDE